MARFKNKTVSDKIIFIITYPIRLGFLGLIYFYKLCLSPMLTKSCKYTPTCSSYGLRAFKEYNPFKAFYLTVRRVLSCNPWSKGGFDPVKDDIKGDIKWLV